MATKIPVKARYTGSDVTALGEYETGDTISSSYLDLSSVAAVTGLTKSLVLPSGTTLEQDPSPSAGYIRWNTTKVSAEIYDGSAWAPVGGGNTTDKILYEHINEITTAYTIATGNNAITAGPITVGTGGSVTVPGGSTWVIA
jgi:hypothetical protein